MLAFLGYHALSKASIINSSPSKSEAIFNLVYQNDGKEQSLTHDKSGFYVGIRRWVGAAPSETTDLLSKSKAVNDLTITPSVEPVSGEDATQVKLKIKNTGTSYIKFDLGVFADASFGTDDDAVVIPRTDARGFYIQNKQEQNNMCTFIVKGQYFPSVNTIYIGTDDKAKYKDPSHYPFFQDDHSKQSNGDSVFGFSWKRITLEANQEIDLGFLVIIGNKVDLRPVIEDLTVKPEHGYDPAKPVELYFKAANYEENQDVKVTITIDDQVVKEETFSPKASSNYEKRFTVSVTLGDKKSAKYTAKAVEVKEGKFSQVSGEIKATKIPKLVITKVPEKKYKKGQQIKISGYVEDEAYATLYYQFDIETEATLSQLQTVTGNKLMFDDLTIFQNYESKSTHYLYIWALDDSGSKSNTFNFEFEIEPAHDPTIYSAYCSDRKVFKGQHVVIYGEADDPDVGQTLTVSVQHKFRGEFVQIGNFTVQNSLIPFAFFYTIPDLPTGNGKQLNVKVEDPDKGNDLYVKIYIDVYDPSKPQKPPGLGNFTNEFENLLGNDENTDACFNPYFKPNAQVIDNPITNNELGIFAAYRKRDLAIGTWRLPSQTKLIYGNKDKMDKSYGPDDKLRITPFTRYEDVTGYFQLCWNVTNLGYFKEYFDLGCFYDSLLEDNDNNTIIPREDGRGISLYNFVNRNLADISYTILWKDYGNLPSISTFSLMPTKVGDGGYIDPADMPFFNSSHKYPEGNAMVAFSWQNCEINGGETLTFGVTFAPAANIKTPTRIIDQTNVENGIAEAGKDINLNFQISDGDVGETIHIKLTVNGTNVIVDKDYNVTSNAIIISENVKVGTVGKYFTYELVAQDTDKRFVTKKVNTLPLTQQPVLLLDKQGMKSKYFRGYLPLTIKGTVVDDDTVVIKYAFDNGRDLVAGKVGPKKDGTFEFNVSYPEELKNGKHFMDVWAEDEYGIRTSQIRDLKNVNTSRVVFEIADLHKPHMLNAGFNTKKAKLNDHLIAFSFVESANTGVMVITQVKFNKGEWMNMNSAYQVQNPAKPMAWYYTITNLAKGDHSVEFRVVDQDGLPSDNTIKRTIHIE